MSRIPASSTGKPVVPPKPATPPAPEAAPSRSAPTDSYISIRAASPRAALQYLRSEFDRALEGRKLVSGAKDINVFDLNAYLAHTDSSNEKHVTGREVALREAVIQAVARQGKRLEPGDLLALSMDLNGDNVASALLTVHNTLRALSRGDDAATGIEEQDLDFFHDYLDTRFRTEVTTRQTDLSDDWYHLFGMATLGFVSRQKGFWELRKEALASTDASFWSAAPVWAGSALNALARLPGGLDALTEGLSRRYGLPRAEGAALMDALGEQVVFGVLMNGMEGGWSEAFSGALDRIKPGGKGITEDWAEVGDLLARGWKRGASAYEADEFKAELYGADLGRRLAGRF